MTATSAKKRPKKKSSKRGPLGVPTGRSRAPKKEPPPKLSRAAEKAAEEKEAVRTIACPTCGAGAGTPCEVVDDDPVSVGGTATWSGTIHTKRWRALERARNANEPIGPRRPSFGVECPTCKAPEGEPCRSRTGELVDEPHSSRKLAAKSKASKDAARPKRRAKAESAQLELDAKHAEYSAGHQRTCPTCGAKPGKDCRVVGSDPPTRLKLEKIGGALVSGMHAARRTLELDLPRVRFEALPAEHHGLVNRATWEQLWKGLASRARHGLPSAPPTSATKRHPWLRVRSIIDGADIVGYALETVFGASVQVHARRDPAVGSQSWGVVVDTVELPSARWWTTREEIEAGLVEAGYSAKQTAELLRYTGWADAETKRKSKSPSKRATKPEPDPSACYECGHADCPIIPDCGACPTCTAAEAPRAGALESVNERLEREIAASEREPARGRRRSPEVLEVRLDLIRRDGGTQPRAVIDPAVVEEYAQSISDGAILPPPVVFCEDGCKPYWLADGFHRVGSYELLGSTHIRCEVRQGGRRDAILYAAGANADHGLRRTRADRRRAVETLLRDEEWSRKTDRWIADSCGVSPTTVGTIRAELSKLDASGAPTMREGQDGKLYPSRAAAPSFTAADDWNVRWPIGTRALYQPPGVAAFEVSTKSEAWMVGDEAMVHILEPRTPAGVVRLTDLRPFALPLQPSLSPAGATPPPIVEPDEDAETCSMCFGLGADDEEGCLACGQVARPVAQDLDDASEGDGATRIEASPVDERREPSDGAERRDAAAFPPSKRKWRDVLELPAGPIDPMLVVEHHVRLSSVLGLTDEARAELDRARAFGLSQWQTMPDLADRMVELAGLAGMDRPNVMEPSAGGGALVAAVRRGCGLDAHITAHEIDPVYCDTLRRAPRAERADVIHEGDFFAWAPPSRPYDAVIANTAYEGGADGRFLARCMDSAQRVTALLRLNAEAGSARHELVWSRVTSGEWCLTDEAVLVNRPGFIGPGEDGAKSDYVVVHLERASIAKRTLTKKVWW